MATMPSDPRHLEADWLTEVLAPHHPGVRVADVAVLTERGSTNHHVRYGVTYDEQADAPDTLFAKMASLDPAHRMAIGATGMGAREARFYDEVADGLDMRIPTSYFAATGDDGEFLLLLEDLAAADCRFSDGIEGISADLIAGGLTDLAAMHVRFEDPAQLDAVRPWVEARKASSPEFTVPMLRQVIDEHADVLSPAYIAVAEMYIEDHAAVLATWESGRRTLDHGDTHIGNVFIDEGADGGPRVGFLDWGLLTVSPPMRDVSYFLTMAMSTDERRVHQEELLRHYLDARRAFGGSDISWDEAWQTHRVDAAYTVLASFLSLVPPYNGEDQRAFSDAFRNRAIAALDDLETVDALRAAMA